MASAPSSCAPTPFFHSSAQSTSGNERGAHRRIGDRALQARDDVVGVDVAGKVRDELVARLLHSLRAELEQRGERGLARAAGVDPHGEPAHAPSASFIFAQNPLPRSAGTACCTFASRSINCSSSGDQLLRRPELDAHVQIAGAARVHAREPAAAQVKELAALRAGGNLERHARRDGRHLDRRAEHELRIGDEHLGVEILAVALEAWIVGDVEHDVDVAALAAALRRVADAAHRHVLTGRDARLEWRP